MGQPRDLRDTSLFHQYSILPSVYNPSPKTGPQALPLPKGDFKTGNDNRNRLA